MESTTETADAERLKEALTSWREWQLPAGSRITGSGKQLSFAPTRLRSMSGFSNQTFLLDAVGHRLVLRLHSDQSRLGVARNQEKKLQDSASRNGLAPALVYWQPDFSVQIFNTGRRFELELDAGRLAEIGELLRRVHELPSSDEFSVLQPARHLQHYLQLASDQLTDQQTQRCEHLLQDAPTEGPVGVCHNDLNGANLLVDDDRILLVDWEYASLGQPAFDIGVFAHTNQLTDDHLQQLLAAYSSPNTPAPSLADVRAHCRLYTAIEALWWLLQTGDTRAFATRLAALPD